MPPWQSADLPDFGAAFTALLTAAGLTVDGVLRALPGDRRGRVSRATLYDWKKGQHLPGDIGPLLEVVQVCLDTAHKCGAALGVAPDDLNGWRRLLTEAKQARDSRTAQGRDIGVRPASDAQAAGGGDDPRDVAQLLKALRDAGADEAAATLATRAAIHAPLDDRRGIAQLLEAMRDAGADEATTVILATRAANHARRTAMGSRTVLEYLIREQDRTYQEVADEFERIARDLGERGVSISVRHLRRLARGERTGGTSAAPAIRRVLTAQFNYPAKQLLEPFAQGEAVGLVSADPALPTVDTQKEALKAEQQAGR